MRQPGESEKGVLFGEGGQLFLSDGGHDVLDFILGKRSVEDESVANFARNIHERRAFAEANRVKYRHVVFPDKQSVLTSDFPFPEPVCLGEIYLSRHPELREAVLYPRQVLQQVGADVFQKTDTHLSDLGTGIVAAEIIRSVVAEDAEDLIEGVLAGIKQPVEWIGDLGGRLSPPLTETKLVYKDDAWVGQRFHNDLNGGNNGLVDLMLNLRARYPTRVLIFGDSFGRDLARFISMFVQETLFLRTPFFHPDLCSQFAPDVLITENVERYLSWCASDDDRPPFLLYPYLSGRGYSPEEAFIRALSAVLSYPRKPYQEFIAEQKKNFNRRA